MRRIWLVGAAAAGLLVGSSAFAQMSTETTTTTWTVKPEERTVIKDYVVKEKIRPAPIREEITIGAAVPAEVQLMPVPAEIYTSISIGAAAWCSWIRTRGKSCRSSTDPNHGYGRTTPATMSPASGRAFFVGSPEWGRVCAIGQVAIDFHYRRMIEFLNDMKAGV